MSATPVEPEKPFPTRKVLGGVIMGAAISLMHYTGMQTAEGALNQMGSIVQRIRELSVDARMTDPPTQTAPTSAPAAY